MKIENRYNLREHNTFGMNVDCETFIQIDSNEEIPEVIDGYLRGRKYYILSGGSNTLFKGNYAGVIIHPATKGIEIVEDTADNVILKVAAGETWDDLIAFCINNNFYGLENLTAIPGLVGSAPVQNIGAYGVEAKDTVCRVHGVNLSTKSSFDYSNEECKFAYRNSVFKSNPEHNLLITDVCFCLSKKEKFTLTYRGLTQKLQDENISLTLKNISEAVRSIRDSKLPDYRKIGNGGSFFKNPVVTSEQYFQLLEKHPDLVAFDTNDGQKKLSAGQLIEKCGWKGRKIGDAGVYSKQALVLVNHGNATPKEILNLADNIISDVKISFDVDLEKEINCV